MTRHYTDDTTIDDVPYGDRLSCVCECGHRTWPAWRTLPKEQQFTPLRDLRRKMVCKRCGARSPTLMIESMRGPGSALLVEWIYPASREVMRHEGKKERFLSHHLTLRQG